MATDLRHLPLGKHPARHDPRTLQFANYLRAAPPSAAVLPPPPPNKSWTAAIQELGPMLNTKIGDCTCAAAGHLIQAWTANLGAEVIVPDKAILGAYRAVSGFVPGDPGTDHGAVVLDVLNYWRGAGIGGHPIIAFAALEPRNREHVKDALNLFGGVYLGVQLPRSAQDQQVWSIPPQGAAGDGAPGSWGGHAIPIVAYDEDGVTVITWGAYKRMTWAFVDTYCDEAYAVVSRDWIDKQGNSPSGFNLAALLADLAEVKDEAASRNTSAALPMNVCRFGASRSNVVLEGSVFSEDDPTGANPLAHPVVNGAAGDEFELAPGDYRYRFDIVAGDQPFDLSLNINGEVKPCEPKTFDPKAGVSSRVSHFTVQ